MRGIKACNLVSELLSKNSLNTYHEDSFSCNHSPYDFRFKINFLSC